MPEMKLCRLLTIPNILSLLRILLIIPLAIYVWQDHLKVVIIIILIAMATDFLDGIIARHFNQITEIGKILDPLADKLAIGTILTVLYLKQRVPLWLVSIVVGRDLLIILGSIFLARQYKFIIPSNVLGKITANILAILVISYIVNIELLEKVFTLLAMIFILLSSYSYLNKFSYLNKSKDS